MIPIKYFAVIEFGRYAESYFSIILNFLSLISFTLVEITLGWMK